MYWLAFCLEQAQNCDERSDEIADPDAKAEWRQMARDWRVAAAQPEPERG
jgi:hypothetical protein